MKPEIQKIYNEKLTTAAEAVKMIRSGDRVYGGTASSWAYGLLQALWDRRHELEGVTILGSNAYQAAPIFDEDEDNPFLFSTFFVGVNDRKQMKRLDYTSVHLSLVDYWSETEGQPDVCLLEVSPPDEDGWCCYGPSGVAAGYRLKELSKKVILQVNRNTPYILGEKNLVHVSEADAICEIDTEYDRFDVMEPDDLSKQIAAYILEEIPDGATFQLGLGNISTAIGYGLHTKNELGIHTELLNQPMIELMRSGNVTNTRKGYLDGKTVFSFSLGNPDLYQEIDRNERFYVVPFCLSNDPRIIAQNRNMISIHATMSLDLWGEAASECVGWKQYSGVGGQLDFVRGAQWSDGGKSFIATTSSFVKNGKRVSKIVPYFAPGTPVTTPRSDIQYVATEFGCVNLKPLNMADRARAMISIAHPDFREELTEQAKKVGLIK